MGELYQRVYCSKCDCALNVNITNLNTADAIHCEKCHYKIGEVMQHEKGEIKVIRREVIREEHDH